MTSLEVSSSLSASTFSAQSSSFSMTTDGSGGRTARLQQSSAMAMSASVESNISLETAGGQQLSLSTEAEFSLKFSQSTQLAIGQEGRTSNRTNPGTTPLTELISGQSEPTESGAGSLFDTESLTQRIYEDNIALFDDFIKNHGGELTKENVKKFVDLMKKTIPEGFRQAKDRLGGFNLMSNGDKTDLQNSRSSVMDKLENFEETMIEKIENGEVSSLDDISFSELPGVESDTRSNPFAGGSNSGFALRFTQQTQIVLATSSSLNASQESTDSPNGSEAANAANQPPQFDVESLSDRIYEDNVSLLDEYLHNRNRDFNQDSFKDFISTIKEGIKEGFDQAQEQLENTDLLTSENQQDLNTVEDNVLNRLSELESDVLDSLEQNNEQADDGEPTSNEASSASSDTSNSPSDSPTVPAGDPDQLIVNGNNTESAGSEEQETEDVRTNLKGYEQFRGEASSNGNVTARPMGPERAAPEALENASERSVLA